MSGYRDCLGQKYSKYLIATNLVGRLPNGMGPLAIAVYLRWKDVGYGTVGGLIALYVVATAVGGPVLGRIVDRRGQVAVLTVGSVLSAAGFALLAVLDDTGPMALAILFSGLFTPPLEPCLRSLWPSVLPDERTVATAYALDASLQQIVFVSGPLLVTGIAAVASPRAALWFTAAAMVVGSVAFACARPVREWRAEPHRADWIGPLRSAPLRRILTSLGCLGVALGVFSVGSVAYAEHADWPQLSGLLLGANAVGALVGGLVYGAARWDLPAGKQFSRLLVGLMLCYCLLATVAPPVVMIALMGIAGVFLSPVLACAFGIIGRVAPRGTVTEAFAWVVTVILAGNAAGSALAGAVERYGLRAIYVMPGAVLLLSVLVAATTRSVDEEDDAPAAPVPEPVAEVSG
ncbi:MFS transporter [Actinomadura terrae]|uniref:MFS transporter n=1 Tax=Actinomadura terrae TaxID=604353 RepID=UPI001FA6BFDF|nr:MFS transporter [Actinomadura terrae]